jgi:hypothetical protein
MIAGHHRKKPSAQIWQPMKQGTLRTSSRTRALWCSAGEGGTGGGQGDSPVSPLNLTSSVRVPKTEALVGKLGAKRNEWPPMHRWASNLSEQTRNVDGEMIKNDIAVLAINTLGQAVVELVSNGPKSTPGDFCQQARPPAPPPSRTKIASTHY